jgi:hypothetical protein
MEMKSFFLMGMPIFLVTGELMTTLKADHLHIYNPSEYLFNHPEGSVHYLNNSEKIVYQGKDDSYGITPYQMKRKTMKPLFSFETDFQQIESGNKNQIDQKISE